jgi:hypothetical protein
MVCKAEPSLLRMRRRPGFSVMRKRPLGKSATAQGVVQAAGDGGDRDVRRLVIGSMRLPRKHRMIAIQFRGALVDGLAFDREFLEGTANGARVAATGRRRLGHQQCGKHRQSCDGADHHYSFHFSLLN